MYLSVEQLHALADESGRYRSLVLLLGAAGLRWGEAAALRVCDMDFLRRRIELAPERRNGRSSASVGTLKSGKNRTMALPSVVIDALAAKCEGKGRDELIWPSASAVISRRRRVSRGCPVPSNAARRKIRRSRG